MPKTPTTDDVCKGCGLPDKHMTDLGCVRALRAELDKSEARSRIHLEDRLAAALTALQDGVTGDCNVCGDVDNPACSACTSIRHLDTDNYPTEDDSDAGEPDQHAEDEPHRG